MKDTELERIHQTSIKILSELGIQMDHPDMRDCLAGLGCRVADTRIYFPPDLVERTVKAIPHSFKLYGRDDKTGVTVDANGPFLCTNTGILPNIYDFESGAIRRSVLADVETTTRVLDALSEVDIVYASLMDATELPSHLITVTDFAATMANTIKPLVGPGIVDGKEARAIIALASTLRNGDVQELGARPPCAPFVGAITPLRFPTDVVDALIEIIQCRITLNGAYQSGCGGNSSLYNRRHGGFGSCRGSRNRRDGASN